MIGDSNEYDARPSAYHPTKAIKNFTKDVQECYAQGDEILNRGWTELNGRTVIDDMNRGQMMFNAFVDESSEDDNDDWEWKGTRSKARNKGIAVHASLTAAYIVPTFLAQNEDDQGDEDMSEFMRGIVEWMIENSDYKPNFLNFVTAMETDPVVYLGAEYNEVMQTIKDYDEDGKMTKKQIIDEVFSGFNAPVYTADQVLVSNAYERDLQKHKRLIKRRWIEYDTASAMYGDKEYFNHVEAGMRTIFNADDGRFYDVKDDDHPSLVEECTFLDRRGDTECCFLGGIYMGDTDVKRNRIRHRDNFNAPKYNLVPFRFNTIGSHFFYGKSMMNAMQWDNMLYDEATRIYMNRALLEAEPPTAVTGVDSVDSEVIFPKAVIPLSDKDSKITNLLPPSNMGPLLKGLEMTEDSMSEGSLNDTETGQLPPAEQKAYIVAKASANAKKIISGVAKQLGWSTARYGDLMKDIAIQHLTIPMLDEISGDTSRLKYRKFILENRNVNGKNVNKEYRFDEDLMGTEMSDEEKDSYNLTLLKESGYPREKKAIYVANPEIFSRLKYLTRADFEELFPRNQEAMQGILSNLYAQLNADPMIEREALLREYMYSIFKSKGNKFIAKKPMQGMGGLPAQTPTNTGKLPTPAGAAIDKAAV